MMPQMGRIRTRTRVAFLLVLTVGASVIAANMSSETPVAAQDRCAIPLNKNLNGRDLKECQLQGANLSGGNLADPI